MPILTAFAELPSSPDLSPVRAADPWLGDTVAVPLSEGSQAMQWTPAESSMLSLLNEFQNQFPSEALVL